MSAGGKVFSVKIAGDAATDRRGSSATNSRFRVPGTTAKKARQCLMITLRVTNLYGQKFKLPARFNRHPSENPLIGVCSLPIGGIGRRQPSCFVSLMENLASSLMSAPPPQMLNARRSFPPEIDGLQQLWRGKCWMNPPYGRDIGLWMAKAYRSSLKGATVVCLVPSRTDTRWWHEWAMRGEIRFLEKPATLCWGTKLSAVSFSRGPLPTKNLPVHGSTTPWCCRKMHPKLISDRLMRATAHRYSNNRNER